MKCFFFADIVSLVALLMGYMKMKLAPSCSPLRAGSDHVLFDLEMSISKSYLRSSQVKVRSRSDPSRLICVSFEVTSRTKWFGTICASLSPSCCELFEKKTDCDVMWPQLTFPWSPIISCTQIFTNGVNGHNAERIGWFRLVYAKWEALSYFPINL